MKTEPLDIAPKRVLLFGATGTAGAGAMRALVKHGYNVTCIIRDPNMTCKLADKVTPVVGDVTKQNDSLNDALNGQNFDVVVSCLASRTGSPKDAWAIDHDAQLNALNFGKAIGATQFILLSAICVQKPDLPFQQAKLAFEAELVKSGLTYSIVRPTAFFKSLSGQIERLRKGKPFLVFGDGALTSCTPISDDDLGDFIASCISETSRHNKILPIGGPGPAITPEQQGLELFRLLGQKPKIKRVPVLLLNVIYQVLRITGLGIPKLAEKAELARIGRYYATESMLVLDSETGHYSRALTPSFGTDTLSDYYAKVIKDRQTIQLGDHSVF